MKVRAEVIHAMPGRVRVRLPDYRGDAQLLAQVEQQLAQSRLFTAVRSNPRTGSLVLEFTGPPAEVLAKLEAALPIEFHSVRRAQAAPGPPLTNALRLVSGREVNRMFLVGTLFGVIGVVQAVRGKIMLPALTAFWYAFDAFQRAGVPAPAGYSGSDD